MTLFTLREAAALIPGSVVIGDENVAFERVATGHVFTMDGGETSGGLASR